MPNAAKTTWTKKEYKWLGAAAVFLIVIGYWIYWATDPSALERKELKGDLTEASSLLAESKALINAKQQNTVSSVFYQTEIEELRDQIVDISSTIENSTFESSIPLSKDQVLSSVKDAEQTIVNVSDAAQTDSEPPSMATIDSASNGINSLLKTL